MSGNNQSEVISNISGRWEEDSTENLEEFLRALAVNVAEQDGESVSNFYEEWGSDGDKVTLTLNNPYLKSNKFFKIGDEFEDETLDNKRAKTIYSIEGGEIVCRQAREPQPLFYSRQVNSSDNTMKLTMRIEDKKPVTAVINFRRA